MRAIVTVMGTDKTGIIASVSQALADFDINILDINQTIMQNIFTMIMLVDISNIKCELASIAKDLKALGEKLEVQIIIQHEDIFNSMHKI